MLSISIVTYQLDCALFRKLLDSLTTAINKFSGNTAEFTVKIIDNGNQKADLEAIFREYKTRLPAVEIISGIKNIGYGRAHNLAILSSTSRYHLILNPDLILDKNCLSEGLAYLETNPDICAVAPSCMDEKGQTQYLAKRYPSLLDLILRGIAPGFIRRLFTTRLSKYEMREVIEEGRAAQVEIISGCFMLCKTDFLKQIGGFDERYFLYFEDFALSMEMRNMGPLHYLPSMKIVHYGGHAARKGFKHIFMFISSGMKFFNCYGWKFI